jgi:hypothetical protein
MARVTKTGGYLLYADLVLPSPLAGGRPTRKALDAAFAEPGLAPVHRHLRREES